MAILIRIRRRMCISVKKIQRTKFDVSQKPLIQKMHTEPEILNWMVGRGGHPALRSTFIYVIRLLGIPSSYILSLLLYSCTAVPGDCTSCYLLT